MLTKQLLELAAVGGEWVLWGLVALSVYSVGLVVERVVWFWRRRCDLQRLVPALIKKLERGVEDVVKVLKSQPAVECQIAARCLEWADAGEGAMDKVLEAQLRERRPELERGTMFLGTIGNNAPFIGLFGTVLGVVEAFVQLGVAGGAGANMEGVMSAIGEALIATAIGIMVAIPAVIAYNLLSRKAAQVEENAEVIVNMVLAGIERQKAGD